MQPLAHAIPPILWIGLEGSNGKHLQWLELELYMLKYFTRRKPHLDSCYNLLICTICVFMDACIKIDTISNLCTCFFGQQLTKYSS